MRSRNLPGRQPGPKAATADVEYPGNPEYVPGDEYSVHPRFPAEYPNHYQEQYGQHCNRAYRGGPREYQTYGKYYDENYSGGKGYEYDDRPYPHHDGKPKYEYKPKASPYGHKKHRKGKALEEVWQVQKVIVKGMPGKCTCAARIQ